VARGVLGVRLTHGWDEVPESPVEVAGRIAPVPLLVVHGDADTFFPVEHPHALVAAAGDNAELWLLPGFGHAENAIDAALADRVGRWVAARGTADASDTIGP